MFFIIGARATGKTTTLLHMAGKDPKSIIVYPNPQMLALNKGKHQRAVTADYLLDCLVKNTVLDWFTHPNDYTFYFEEPSLYWTTFLQILALIPKDKLKAAAYTPNNKQQSTLEQINPCLISKVLKMSWEELPKCPRC